MQYQNSITKLEIDFISAEESRSAVFVDGKLIMSSNWKRSSSLCLVGEVTDNISTSFPGHDLKVVNKKEYLTDFAFDIEDIEDIECFEDFYFDRFQKKLEAHCKREIEHSGHWPDSFEYSRVVFSLNEFHLFLTKAVWDGIASDISDYS